GAAFARGVVRAGAVVVAGRLAPAPGLGAWPGACVVARTPALPEVDAPGAVAATARDASQALTSAEAPTRRAIRSPGLRRLTRRGSQPPSPAPPGSPGRSARDPRSSPAETPPARARPWARCRGSG